MQMLIVSIVYVLYVLFFKVAVLCIYSKCYQFGQFENAVNYLSIQAEKVLARFFRLVNLST